MPRPLVTLSPQHAFFAGATGLLGALSFPPAKLWPLAIVATCLFLRLLRDKEVRTAFPMGLLYGIVYTLGTMYWFFGIFQLLAVSLIGLAAFYFAFLACLVGMTRGYNPCLRAVLVGLFAAGIEWLRGDAWYLRFPWYTLPHALAQAPAWIAPVYWLGTYGFTSALWTIAALGAFVHYRLWALFVLAPACSLLLPAVSPPTFKALLVQAEWPEQIEAAMTQATDGSVQLAVLPEYAYSMPYESALSMPHGPRTLSRKYVCPVVFGAKADVTETSYRNVAVVLDSQGQVLGTFTKQRPIPLFRDGVAGTERPVFPVEVEGQRPLVLGVAICYDFDAPAIASSLVRNGATVLVAPTRDPMSWGETQHVHHELLARLRAVENDRWFVRATSSGRTEAINPHGEPSEEGIAIDQSGGLIVAFGSGDSVPLGSQAYVIGPAAALGIGLFLMAFIWRQIRNRWTWTHPASAPVTGA